MSNILKKENNFFGCRKPHKLLSGNESNCSFSLVDSRKYFQEDLHNNSKSISVALKHLTTEHTIFKKRGPSLLKECTSEIMIEALAFDGPGGTLKIPIVVESIKSNSNHSSKKKKDFTRCRSSLLRDKLKGFVLQEENNSSLLKNSCWDNGFDSPQLQLRRKNNSTEKKSYFGENNEEKLMITDMIQKTKYVFLSIFYLSHYKRVMNFMMPSSKKKLQILKDLESNSSLSPVFRRIQRGDSPTRNRKLSTDFSGFLLNCTDEGEDNTFFNVKEENDNSFIVNEVLKELEKKENNIVTKEGKRWILLKRNQFFAENERFLEERREILEKYFVWKMKKWSNVSKK